MKELKVFQNSEFGQLEVLTIEGKEYFPASACARVLGYVNPRKAIIDHCNPHGVLKRDAWVQTGVKVDGSVAMRNTPTNYITEGNLYRLIVSSKLSGAERFERWVFDEVLPTIRKQGGYVTMDKIAEIIQMTTSAVVTEMMKQIIPLLTQQQKPAQMYPVMSPFALPEPPDINWPFVSPYRPVKSTSIIGRLVPELRQMVEVMICSDQYTQDEIVVFLATNGVQLSRMAVSRYKNQMLLNGQL